MHRMRNLFICLAVSFVLSSPRLVSRPSDVLDQRLPVPLSPHLAQHQKENMREYLEAVQGIVAGLAARDFKAIERSAKRMGFSEKTGKMCGKMGAAAGGFTERAIQFHKTADLIAAAARKFDEHEVLSALRTTLTQCTGCHSTYRQEIVDEPTLKLLTAKTQKAN